jgi:NAD(P)-dependent dehydrogenase (short-subunit alcohol dehydrogenase family)
MRERFSGKRAVVTGATGGLGSACAVALADAGAAVVLLSRSAAGAAALCARTGGHGIACDVTDAGAVSDAFAELGDLDVLVTCAGGNRPQPYVDVTAADLEWSLALNVAGAFLAGQAAAKSMIARGRGGAIVHVTSQMGHVGGIARSVYCTAKHAVEGLTKATAIELAPYGIRVNAVAPTFVETAMTRPFLAAPGHRAAVVDRIPIGRLGTPDEVAAAVLFAASDEASLMTGASLLVDGGWTAQ